MRYQVVIVEDDPMVRMLDRSFVELDHRFTVAGEFQDGRAALQWLRNHPADLLILDVYMPSMTGVELLKALREEEIPLDAIMVTAANDAKTVDTLLHLGVVDYLVKPLGQERLQRALDAFCRFREALHDSVTQEELDALFPRRTAAGSLPKGLQAQTLGHLRQCLSRAGRACTSEELAAAAGLSVVTVRRYMNYLVDQGEAVSRINYDTGGRPCALYVLRRPDETEKP